MKMRNILKKPKVSKEDLDKIGKTITEIKDCPLCRDNRNEIKKCMENHNVKNNLKSVLKHEIKCPDCRARIQFITECKKRGHK